MTRCSTASPARESQPAVKGYDITTTINVQLQDIVENELNDMCIETGADWGTCVLMEVATGEIKAVSNLELDPTTGNYVEGVNHAVLGYEPGSVVKTISMMVALEDGIVDNIEEPIVTGSTWTYAGGNPITDSHGGATRTPRQIIETSSNIGMAKIIVIAALWVLLIPATCTFMYVFFIYDGMTTIIRDKEELSRELTDSIDKSLEKRKNAMNLQTVEEDFSDIDISSLKDTDDYIFHNGRMVKQSTLLRMIRERKQQEAGSINKE